jgi:1,4-dihydroxy-2-naphthoyl-CoA hydrolase
VSQSAPLMIQPASIERFNAAGEGNHHGWLGLVVTAVEHGRIEADMLITPQHLNPGGGIHGGVTASFADTMAAYGLFASLPPGAEGFTTVNLSAQYLGRALLGDTVHGVGTLAQGGRQMQTWDVTVTNSTNNGTLVGLVRVTQLLRYPKPA